MSDMDAIRARLRETLRWMERNPTWSKEAEAIRALLDSEARLTAENERLHKNIDINLEQLETAEHEVKRLTAEVETLRMTELPQGWMAAPKVDWDKLTAEVERLEKELAWHGACRAVVGAMEKEVARLTVEAADLKAKLVAKEVESGLRGDAAHRPLTDKP